MVRVMNALYSISLGLVLVTGLSGCATRKAQAPVPISQNEISDYFGRAQDPRRFWITVYETDDGPRFAGAHRLHTDKFAERPFESPRNSEVPVIAVRFRSIDNNLALIDTSSRASWITYELAMAAGTIPVGPPAYRLFPTHVDDPIPGFLSVASRLTLDELHMENALLYVKAAKGDMPELMRQRERILTPVVLGADFIRAFYFMQMHFPERSVRFSTTRAYTPDPSRLITSVPMREVNASIAVAGFIDGVETPFLIDSVGDFEVAMPIITPMTVQQISIGDLVLRRVSAQPASAFDLGMPDIPRIGARLLSRFVVTFDSHQKIIYFEKP